MPAVNIREGDLGDVFANMRNHLISVRRYHKIVLWVVIAAFIAFVAVDIYKLLDHMQRAVDYLEATGSGGIACALLWFGQRALWSNRVSQLSLALFESQVAEVSASLAEIPKSASAEERRKLRATIWHDFRSGIDRIWLAEKKLLILDVGDRRLLNRNDLQA